MENMANQLLQIYDVVIGMSTDEFKYFEEYIQKNGDPMSRDRAT